MNIDRFEEKCNEVGEYWGSNMPARTVEEASELILAICKYERAWEHPECEIEEYEQNLIDEMGDMIISLMALRHKISKWITNLDERLEKRIEEKLNKKYDIRKKYAMEDEP